jgi:hypothetical protein
VGAKARIMSCKQVQISVGEKILKEWLGWFETILRDFFLLFVCVHLRMLVVLLLLQKFGDLEISQVLLMELPNISFWGLI